MIPILTISLMVSCVAYSNNVSSIDTLSSIHNGDIQTGSIIRFGNHDWRILEIHDDNTALIITENIVEIREFHNIWESVTWEESDLRKHLNSVFIDTFSQEEQRRILPKNIQTPNNEWFQIRGGNDTRDYIFLLSIEEVVKYFGDSEQLEAPTTTQHGIPQSLLSDQYNDVRIATDGEGIKFWWWLRSSGFDYDAMAFVSESGTIDIAGSLVAFGHWRDYNLIEGGVRPALLLSIAE